MVVFSSVMPAAEIFNGQELSGYLFSAQWLKGMSEEYHKCWQHNIWQNNCSVKLAVSLQLNTGDG